jgi:hypothetical protein
MDRTEVNECCDTNIPASVFHFTPLKEINDHPNLYDKGLFDVIGHVVGFREMRTVDRNGQKSNVMDLTLEDNEALVPK